MAKNSKSEKKARKLKVPKEIGGAKVPKGLRKAGNKALKLAGEPIVGEAVAAALLTAAAALRETPAAQSGARAASDAAAEGAEEVAREAGKLGESLRNFALNLARMTLDAWEEKAAAGGSKGSEKAG